MAFFGLAALQLAAGSSLGLGTGGLVVLGELRGGLVALGIGGGGGGVGRGSDGGSGGGTVGRRCRGSVIGLVVVDVS